MDTKTAIQHVRQAERGSLTDLGKLLEAVVNGDYRVQGGDIVTSTDAGTLALTAAEHGGRIVYFSDADGTITMPNALGTGVRFEVVLATAATGMTITVKPSTDEEFAGGVMGVDDDADAAYAWKAEDDDDTISLDGTSTGGKVHDWFRFTDIADGIWLVEGFITQSGGAEATPFSAAISS